MKHARLALGIGLTAACGIDATLLRESPAVDAGEAVFDAGYPENANGVFAGQAFTCGLWQGQAACWGDNGEGALGTGDDESRLAPTTVATFMHFASMAPGGSHTCGVRAPDGAVACWGDNSLGQLGLGDTTARTSPQVVPLASPARRLTAGYEHSCAVLMDGSLWCWGDNSEGQLGLNDAYGSPNASSPTRVGQATDWLTVSGGQGHTCGIRAPGTMWCWGRNTSYELGLGTVQPIQLRAPTQVGTLSDWVYVELGQDDACAVRKDGSLWCWGDGTSGQLASPPGLVMAPTQVGTDTDWTTVATDAFSTCALKATGALYCWGRNAEGQLGLGDTTDRTSPTVTGSDASFGWVAVGRFHSCGETPALQVLCTGANESGELGVGDTLRRTQFTPVIAPLTTNH
jgi:alpha-tubulin suppressor-like RCC1 family protein